MANQYVQCPLSLKLLEMMMIQASGTKEVYSFCDYGHYIIQFQNLAT